MRIIIRLTALVAFFCFVPLQEARGGVSSDAGVWYFEATNEEWGVAWISPDYVDQTYYNMYVEAGFSAVRQAEPVVFKRLTALS